MLGGIIVNLILGFVIYSGVLYTWGETKLPNVHPVNVDPVLEDLGFQDGDRVLGYNGRTLEYYGDLRMEGFNKRVTEVDLLRDGKKVTSPWTRNSPSFHRRRRAPSFLVAVPV